VGGGCAAAGPARATGPSTTPNIIVAATPHRAPVFEAFGIELPTAFAQPTQALAEGAVFKHETGGRLKLFPYRSRILNALHRLQTPASEARTNAYGGGMPSAERTGRSLRRASSNSAPGSD
jgi:hypothetical protein